MKITALQLNGAWLDKEKNFEKVRKLTRNLKTDIIVLPELFATGVVKKGSKKFAEPYGGKTTKFLKALAKQKKAFVIGTYAQQAKGKPKNALVVFDKKGRLKCIYEKIQLCSPTGENKGYSSGDKLKIFNYGKTKCGVLICYDLRFPELFRALIDRGVKVIFLVANWPKPRDDHWETLLRARAIENQCYVIGVNRAGKLPINPYFGKSMMIDPWGRVIKKGKTDKEDVITAKIDVNLADKIRKEFVALKDRRQKLYKKLMFR